MPLILDGTLGETYPSWTTATRPSSPTVGQVGFNSTLSVLEAYNGTAWVAGGLPNPSTSTNVLKSNGTDWVSGAFPWVVTNVGTNISTTPSSYTIPANAIMVVGTGYHPMGSNNGSRISVNIKNSSGTTLFTYNLTGGNEVPGGDGGSGMSTRSGWMVPIPSAAAGGTLEFFRSSGGLSFVVTINQVITSA
jgi:hypothetical protein